VGVGQRAVQTLPRRAVRDIFLATVGVRHPCGVDRGYTDRLLDGSCGYFLLRAIVGDVGVFVDVAQGEDFGTLIRDRNRVLEVRR